MKRVVALVLLMILASCASVDNPKPSKATQAEEGLKGDQDFSHSPSYIEEIHRIEERRGYI